MRESERTNILFIISGVILMIALAIVFSGCSVTDTDLKTTNCSAKIEINSDCSKDDEVIAEIVKEVSHPIDIE